MAYNDEKIKKIPVDKHQRQSYTIEADRAQGIENKASVMGSAKI